MVLLNVQQPNRSGDRLGFPGCPACRQDSLLGLLAPETLFSRRVQALLASGVLALSVGATGTSIAAEPDRLGEGVVLPGQPPEGSRQAPEGSGQAPEGTDRTEGTDHVDDLGSAPAPDTELPLDVDPNSAGPEQGSEQGPVGGDEDSAPPEVEPADEPGEPDAPVPPTEPPLPPPPAVEGAPLPPVEAAPPPPAPPAQPPRSNEARPKRAPSLVPDDPAPTTGGPRPERRWQPPRNRRDREASGRPRREGQHGVLAIPPMQPSPATTSVVAVIGPVDAPSPATPTAHIPDDARFHVVRRGESLWSIATAQLGRDAPAEQVAHGVDRLWALNERRIGTGDPDLLPVGVRLVLR